MEIQRLNMLLQPTQSSAVHASGTTQRTSDGASFGRVLADAIQQVEQDQRLAEDAAVRLAAGQVTDLAAVMIASERANLTLGLAVQIRNKALEAYQEIMRMSL